MTLTMLAVSSAHGWWRRPRRCPGFVILGDGSIRFSGSYTVWRARKQPILSRYVVGVALLGPGPRRARTLRVYADSLDREQWRRLRALLNSRLVCMGSQNRKSRRLKPRNLSNFQRHRGSIGVPVREQTGPARGE